MSKKPNLSVGRGEKLDLDITAAVRREIGDARLRLDANEGWSVLDAINMCRKLEKYDIEFIEQPTVSWSIPAMAHVREKVGISRTTASTMTKVAASPPART